MNKANLSQRQKEELIDKQHGDCAICGKLLLGQVSFLEKDGFNYSAHVDCVLFRNLEGIVFREERESAL